VIRKRDDIETEDRRVIEIKEAILKETADRLRIGKRDNVEKEE
jgi:hypothetical protein